MHTEISPWIEKLSPYRLVIALGAAFLALVVALAWVGWRWSVALDRMEIMQRQAAAGFLQAPTSSRTVRIDLRNPSSVSIGGGDFPERVDFLVNARTPRFARFRVSLLRDDGTLLLHADQLVRDSNMDLRFSLNSSILPQGRYVIRVEGYGRKGQLERFAEARLSAG
ncbi:MAG TPA: hypothetical protein VFM30_04655 [Steroidobacteraceae bacterium]|jgi:hypothetical protein|nr:hypothetical protein [Steroidobacteraceae bacterium]